MWSGRVCRQSLKGKNLVSITARSTSEAPAVALRFDWTDSSSARSSLFTNEKSNDSS